MVPPNAEWRGFLRPAEYGDNLRAIVDFCGVLPTDTSDSELKTVSHLIIVEEDATAAKPEIHASAEVIRIVLPGSLSYSQKAALAGRICNDIFLDASMFYSLPYLKELYPDSESRRRLSLDKVAFWIENGQKYQMLYGSSGTDDRFPYIPLAGLCKGQLTERIAPEKLLEIWVEFLHFILRPGCTPSGNQAITVATVGELIQLIEGKFTHLRGRISANVISKALGRVKPSPHCLRFFVLLERKLVGSGKATGQKLFRKGKTPRPGHIAILNCSDILELSGLRQWVKIVPFIDSGISSNQGARVLK